MRLCKGRSLHWRRAGSSQRHTECMTRSNPNIRGSSPHKGNTAERLDCWCSKSNPCRSPNTRWVSKSDNSQSRPHKRQWRGRTQRHRMCRSGYRSRCCNCQSRPCRARHPRRYRSSYSGSNPADSCNTRSLWLPLCIGRTRKGPGYT